MKKKITEASILIVEDEPQINDVVSYSLQQKKILDVITCMHEWRKS